MTSQSQNIIRWVMIPAAMYQSRVCYSVCVCVHSTRPGFKSIFHAAITSHAHVTKSTIVLKANILQFLCRYKALQESCLWVWATTQLFNTYTQCLSQPPARSFTQTRRRLKAKTDKRAAASLAQWFISVGALQFHSRIHRVGEDFKAPL